MKGTPVYIVKVNGEDYARISDIVRALQADGFPDIAKKIAALEEKVEQDPRPVGLRLVKSKDYE